MNPLTKQNFLSPNPKIVLVSTVFNIFPSSFIIITKIGQFFYYLFSPLCFQFQRQNNVSCWTSMSLNIFTSFNETSFFISTLKDTPLNIQHFLNWIPFNSINIILLCLLPTFLFLKRPFQNYNLKPI